VRLVFLCGRRALTEYRAKNELVLRLAAEFTCSADETPAAIERLRSEVKTAQRTTRQAQATALAYEAQMHRARGESVGSAILITHVFTDRDPNEVRGLANALVQQPGVIALLGLAGSNAQLVYARTQDAPGAMQSLLALSLPHLGAARGGGSPVYAQGGGVAADVAQVQAALMIAAHRLRADIQA
jgi:alanyl-tRNA synthetase